MFVYPFQKDANDQNHLQFQTFQILGESIELLMSLFRVQFYSRDYHSIQLDNLVM